MMLTEEGKYLVGFVLFLIGLFACGYFMGWSRDKLSVKIFNKMIDSIDKVKYWQGRYDETSEHYSDLIRRYRELKEYTLGQVGKEFVPEKFGGELVESLKEEGEQ